MENENTNSFLKGTGVGNSSRADEEEAVAGASDRLGSMTLSADDTPTSVSKDADKCCASCGKTGNGLKRCTACKSVWYCGVNCQIDHRKKHKKECKRIKKELEAKEKQEGEEKTEGQTDGKREAKFTLWNPRPGPECPICMVVLPLNPVLSTYMSCCGKTVCGGCTHTMLDGKGALWDNTCPFCREAASVIRDAEEGLRQMQKRAALGDANSTSQLSQYYQHGQFGLSADPTKAHELLQRAADMGSADANYLLGNKYFGDGAPGLGRIKTKAKMHWEFAAKNGNAAARYNLGILERGEGNMVLAVRHFQISAKYGYKNSLKALAEFKECCLISEAVLEESKIAYNEAIQDMRTEDRDRYAQFLLEKSGLEVDIYDLYTVKPNDEIYGDFTNAFLDAYGSSHHR